MVFQLYLESLEKQYDTGIENLKRINPQVEVITNDIILSDENIIETFSECDLTIEAFDRAEMKALIIEAFLHHMPDKYLITGHGLGGFGNFELLEVINDDKVILCGDFVSEVSDELPPLAPRVGIVANMQANEALKILLDINDHEYNAE